SINSHAPQSWPDLSLDKRDFRYFPGHIHAFYLEYVYFDRQVQAREGFVPAEPAPGVYSDNIQAGGQGYGTVNSGPSPVY
ncbi:hypothetical protein LTR28_004592, partial [Elasticomyces elasticus]